MEVTRELVQLIPSQPLPQGSDPIQLGGRFCQLAWIEKRTAAASESKHDFQVLYQQNLFPKILLVLPKQTEDFKRSS